MPAPRLHEFIETHAGELLEQCQRRAFDRGETASVESASHGISMFIPQLVASLRGDRADNGRAVEAISTTASRHGSDLQREGFTVNQVVHGYGDLCQSITELAVQHSVPISSEDFQTLNRCLDHAIADAVTEYLRLDTQVVAKRGELGERERLGFLAHELRNHLNVVTLAFGALKSGAVGSAGATAAVIDRNLLGLGTLIERALAFVRLSAPPSPVGEPIAMDRFFADLEISARLAASGRGASFCIVTVPPDIYVMGDSHLLHSAVSNLLHNAFKFTQPGTGVSLRAVVSQERVQIEVADQCGGLPPGMVASIVRPFQQHGMDRSGLGLGLTIAKRAAEALDGTLRVRDIAGHGCVFTLDLPRGTAAHPANPSP